MRYTTCTVDCREVMFTSGPRDGCLAGYIVRRPWEDDRVWHAYELNHLNNLIWLGRFKTIEEAASMVGG